MKVKSALFAALLVLGGQASAQKLGSGMTWPQFQERFASSADFDKEALVRISGCTLKAVPNKPLQSFVCQVAGAGLIDGLTVTKGPLRDVTISFVAHDMQSIHSFQRAAKYLIYATQGGRKDGALGMVVDLMTVAKQSPDKEQAKEIDGVRYATMYQPKGISGPTWVFSAEKV